jgi:hypothetical protein
LENKSRYAKYTNTDFAQERAPHMKVVVIALLLALLASLSGCYVGGQNVGQVGFYYQPPYTRPKPPPSSEYIIAPPVTYVTSPAVYPFWY